MPYAALPDRRMPYDNDGTIVYEGNLTSGAVTLRSGSALQNMQDDTYSNVAGVGAARQNQVTAFLFFPEQREVTAWYHYRDNEGNNGTVAITGSNDTTNGLDGTWETASLPSGQPGSLTDVFDWRTKIRPISFTGPKKNVRVTAAAGSGGSGGTTTQYFQFLHLYGEAAAGAMAHDLEFINHDDTPGVAFTAPEDFGDQPLGTTVVRQFRVKNTSATKTATNVNLQCNDADFTIGESASGPWVVTINIASLGPGAESATLYCRLTTPAVGAPLKPRFARIVAVTDAGFFG